MFTLVIILAIFALLIIVIAAVLGIDFGPVVASLMMLSLWTGLAVAAIAHIVSLMRPGLWRLDVRAPWLIIAILATGITLPLFELFKQHILPLRGFPLDPAIAGFERFLFFGNDAWMLSHAVFGSVSATLFIDRVYGFWLPMMFAFPVVVVMAAHDIGLRARLLGCWLMSWVFVAGFGAWVFGSAGPCYYTQLVGSDQGFSALSARLSALGAEAHAKGQVIAAIDFQAMLLNGQSATELLPAGGISAMPSMHVAMAVLFAIAGFQFGRVWGVILSGYALLIWIGSIHLGWHYATDGIVGAAMMIALWRISGKYLDAKMIASPTPNRAV